MAPAIAERHPIAVMIDDLGPARPQSGLASASVVWHAPAEGGIPRYMAIFQDDLPEDIGPVRSSRYYYIAWAVGVEGHLRPRRRVAAGDQHAPGEGQRPVRLQRRRVPPRRSFRRINWKFAPHNLYTTGKQMRSLGKRIGAKDKAYKTVWKFAPDAPLDDRPTGGSITVKYRANAITYKYDRKTNTYLRSVTGEKKEKDEADGRRIAPKNVVVMMMRFGPLNDGSHKHRLEATVIGSGKRLDQHQRQDHQGHVEEDGHDQADPLLRLEGQRGHADRRTDLRPGHAERLPGLVQEGHDDRARHRPARRRMRRRRARHPPPDGRDPRQAVADPGRRVDRPRLPGHVTPGPAGGRGALPGTGGDPVVDEVLGPDRAERDGEPVDVAGLDEDAGRADQVGQRPDRRRHDRRPDRDGIERTQPGRVGEQRQYHRSGVPDEAGDDGRASAAG